LILLAFPGLGTDAKNADEGMGTLVCEITGSFPRDPPKCPGGSPLQVSGTVGNTFNWNSPNEGPDSPTEFILSQLQTADDLIALVGHSYGANNARLFAQYVRRAHSLLPDSLITVDPIDWVLCNSKRTRCNQSDISKPFLASIGQVVDYVQRTDFVFQGYLLLGTKYTLAIIPNIYHDKIDNDEQYVHPAVSSRFRGLLRTPRAAIFAVTGVTVFDITSTSATITWSTTKSVGSFVEYGLSQAYDGAFGDMLLNQTHRTTLICLLPSTTYHFSIVSAVSSNPKPTNDATFTTAP